MSGLCKRQYSAKASFHAKKTRPIWAIQLREAATIETLEGTERAPAGSYLCRGEAGEVWPQTADRLTAKYVATDEVDADGWRKYEPHPDAVGVLAAQIDHAFTAQVGR